MVVCLHEVIYRKVILSVVKSRPAANDLLELDYGVDRPHQHYISDVTGVDPGG